MASSAQSSNSPPTQPDQNEQQIQQSLVLSEHDHQMMTNDPAESLIDESEFEIVNSKFIFWDSLNELKNGEKYIQFLNFQDNWMKVPVE